MRKEQTAATKMYPKEIYEFVKYNSKGIDSENLVRILREKFGKEYTQKQIREYRTRIKAPSGVRKQFGEENGNPMGDGNRGKNGKKFKDGERPANALPVGSIKRKGKYLYIKYKDEPQGKTKNWMPLSRYVLITKNGSLDKDDLVMVLDGNYDNVSPENLAPVNKRVACRFGITKGQERRPEINLAKLRVLQIKDEVNQIEKNRRSE